MIDRFGTLFVGSVEHDTIGFDAPAVNARRYDSATLAGPLQHGVDLAELMDRVGYDTMWLAEHHFQHEGYEVLPNVVLMATHLAGRTERLRFGCGFNILPMWHPLRLAEDFAMADILTGGRVRLGIGRGYHARELEMFGAPFYDADAARDRFEEQVEVLMAALGREGWDHHGTHYDLPPPIPYRGYELAELTVVPRPQHPVECWQPIVSGSERGLDIMIRHGIKGFVGGGASSGGANDRVIERWRDKLAEAGRDTELGTDLIIGFTVILADTVEQAVGWGRPILEEYQKMFAPLGFAGEVTDEQLRLLADPATAASAGMGSVEDAIDSGGWICGPADLVGEELQRVQDRYPGLCEVMVAQPVGAPASFAHEQIERFAVEVMPGFAPGG